MNEEIEKLEKQLEWSDKCEELRIEFGKHLNQNELNP